MYCDYKFIAIDTYCDFLLCVTGLGFCGEWSKENKIILILL